MNGGRRDETSRRRRSWWTPLVTLALGCALVFGMISCLQRKLIYFPDASAVPRPSGPRFEALETVEITTADGVHLSAWYWPGLRPVTLVVFHGNAGHRGHRLEWLEMLHTLGLGIFILDYRGYGGSEGAPSETGLYADADAVVDWLESRGAPSLVYLGESLGSGVAVELAVRHPPEAVIIQSGFSSLVETAGHHYPFLPVSLLLSDRYESERKVGKISCPLLAIHGARDTIVPLELGRKLFDAAPEPKEFLLLEDAAHNDVPWAGGRRYLETIDSFVRRFVDEPAGGR